MSETEALGGVWRQSSDADCVAAIERAIHEGSDRDLCRINPLAFATKRKLDEERTISAFLHASRLGIFELSWNVLCPGCGGVLESGTTLKTVNRDEYNCALCAFGYQPTLDEMVEVTFTVSPRMRRIAAHSRIRCRTSNITDRFSGALAWIYLRRSTRASQRLPSIQSSLGPVRRRCCRCKCLVNLLPLRGIEWVDLAWDRVFFQSFCSIGTILPPRPARAIRRRAQRRSRMARLRATASAARSVLDGREHDGMIERVGD